MDVMDLDVSDDSEYERLKIEDDKIQALIKECGFTGSGYPRLLTYHYDNISKPGKIEFMLPTKELLQKVKHEPPKPSKPFNPSTHYSDGYHSELYKEYTYVPGKLVMNIKSFSVEKLEFISNPNEYNCSQWNFAIKWDKTKLSSKDNGGFGVSSQEFGIAYAKNENVFLPICETRVKIEPKEEKNGKVLFTFFYSRLFSLLTKRRSYFLTLDLFDNPKKSDKL